MAATGTGGAEPRHQEKSGTPIVVVDLEEAQPARLVKRLRKGQGKLMSRVERIVADLVEAGTVKSTAQPVVIVVRETPVPFWSFEEEDD
jgi:Family of unknown function (DUF6200)